MTVASLRSRLFLGITVMILVTGGIGGWLAYRWAYSEAIEMQDSVLIQIGSLVQAGTIGGSKPIRGVDTNAEVTMVEMPALPCAESEHCRLARLPDGLHLAVLNGEPVRALLASDPAGRRLAVTQRTALRDEIGGDFALRSLLPIMALIPCLLLVTGLVIAYSLRPVVRMARALDMRRADDLNALPVQALPSEIVPFVASINRLFARIQETMLRERRFIGEAAHELRSPVTALSLQVANVDHVDLPPATRARVAALKAGAQRLKHLLDQLLALARQDGDHRIQPPVVDLADIAKQTVADLLPAAADEGVDVGFTSLQVAEIHADPFELATLVRNLVDNAIRYTPSGGRVDIDVHAAGDVVILQMVDTGPGVDASDLTRLFEPFYRGADPVEDGSGLGLAIVKRIADRYGGAVSLQNRSKADATGLHVTVRLPRAHPEA
jgi:two-component system, OmpR family, sensor kinase